MNRVVMHVSVILITGILIGLIVRGRREAARVNSDQVSVSQPIEFEAPEGWLQDFELVERSGQKVTSEMLSGQPYVASFFFTTCPSTCPMQNEKLRILQEDFKDQDVRFLSISCDPEVDTPDVLKDYANKYNADEEQWLFLTGDLNYIRRVGAEIFQLPVMKKFHADRFVLMDSQGKLTAFYEWKEPDQFDKLKSDIAAMLNSTEQQGT